MASFSIPDGILPAGVLSSITYQPYTAVIGSSSSSSSSAHTPVFSPTTASPANFIPGSPNPGQDPGLFPPANDPADSRKSHISTVLIALVALAGIFIIGVPLLITWRRHHRPRSEPARPRYIPSHLRNAAAAAAAAETTTNPTTTSSASNPHHRHDYGSNYYSRGFDDSRRHRRLWAAADLEAQAGFERQQLLAARRLLREEGLDERGEAPPPYKKDHDDNGVGVPEYRERGEPEEEREEGRGRVPAVPPPAYFAGGLGRAMGEEGPVGGEGRRAGRDRGGGEVEEPGPVRGRGGTVTASSGTGTTSATASTTATPPDSSNSTASSSSPTATTASNTTSESSSTPPPTTTPAVVDNGINSAAPAGRNGSSNTPQATTITTITTTAPNNTNNNATTTPPSRNDNPTTTATITTPPATATTTTPRRSSFSDTHPTPNSNATAHGSPRRRFSFSEGMAG